MHSTASAGTFAARAEATPRYAASARRHSFAICRALPWARYAALLRLTRSSGGSLSGLLDGRLEQLGRAARLPGVHGLDAGVEVAHRRVRPRMSSLGTRASRRAALQRAAAHRRDLAAAAGAEPPFFGRRFVRQCFGAVLRRYHHKQPRRRRPRRGGPASTPSLIARACSASARPCGAASPVVMWLTARFPRLAARGTRAFRFMHSTSKDGSDAAMSSKGRLQSSACDRDAARRRGHMYFSRQHGCRTRQLHSGCADGLAVRLCTCSARAAPMRHFCPARSS